MKIKIVSPPETGEVRIGDFYVPRGKLHQRQLIRLNELHAFFTKEKRDELLIPIVRSQTDVSLRALDWFVVNFAKRRKVVCSGHDDSVFTSYKNWLRHFRRRDFDPFRRRQRIKFQVGKFDWEETTVGQLNFLKWCETYDVISQARQNLEEVEGDMTRTLAASKKAKRDCSQSGIKKRRTPLTPLTGAKCHVFPIETTVEFD